MEVRAAVIVVNIIINLSISKASLGKGLRRRRTLKVTSHSCSFAQTLVEDRCVEAVLLESSIKN